MASQKTFVFGDDTGVIYSINAAAHILWDKDLVRDGTQDFANAGYSKDITSPNSRWTNLSFVSTKGDGIIYAITSEGTILWYKDLGLNGTVNWANNGLAKDITSPNSNWTNLSHVFCGGDGIIYAITITGTFLWYKDLGRDGKVNWANNGFAKNITLPNSHWRNLPLVFSGGDGIIYTITKEGDLYWYKDLGRDGTANWANNGIGKQIASGWIGLRCAFGGGDGVIYSTNQAGELKWNKDLARDGTANWAINGIGNVIGTGWNYGC